jgi:hypothetical protein
MEVTAHETGTHVLIRVRDGIRLRRAGDFLPDGSYLAEISGGRHHADRPGHRIHRRRGRPGRQDGHRGFSLFLESWRRKNRLGLPDQVYVRVPGERKPFFADFRNFSWWNFSTSWPG